MQNNSVRTIAIAKNCAEKNSCNFMVSSFHLWCHVPLPLPSDSNAQCYRCDTTVTMLWHYSETIYCDTTATLM